VQGTKSHLLATAVSSSALLCCVQQHIESLKNSFSIAKTFIGLLGIVYMSDCAGHNVTFACGSCIILCIAVLATAY
jgi:hypothetical protein